jgi:hypothetical protein
LKKYNAYCIVKFDRAKFKKHHWTEIHSLARSGKTPRWILKFDGSQVKTYKNGFAYDGALPFYVAKHKAMIEQQTIFTRG